MVGRGRDDDIHLMNTTSKHFLEVEAIRELCGHGMHRCRFFNVIKRAPHFLHFIKTVP